MGIKVHVQQKGPVGVYLRDIPNGTFFLGVIDGYVSAGPFMKVGSITANAWIVVKLERPEGIVWCSHKPVDVNVMIRDYVPLRVAEIVLRDQPSEAPNAASSTRSITTSST